MLGDFSTEILHLAETPFPDATVRVKLPVFFAVIKPVFESTVATFVLEEVHFKSAYALAGVSSGCRV